jgi:hypothetical protein
MVRVSRDWQYRGMPALLLENSRIRVAVLPSTGGRIFQFIDKRGDADLLWHHPRRSPEPVTLGSPGADLWWTGGIDDIFPTDFPCSYRNEALPYLGELWTNAWDWQVEDPGDGDSVAVRLSTRTVISPFEVEKRITLRGEEDRFRVRWHIRNIGYSEYDWYFGIHPGVEVTRGSGLVFPLRAAVIDDSWPPGLMGGKGTEYRWPLCPTEKGGNIDLREVPGPEAGWWTFQYGLDLQEDFLGVLDPTARRAFCMGFDRAFFPNLNFYLGYGGWRNTYSIIPQIATGWPAALSDTVAAGHHRTLGPGESTFTEVTFHCLTEVASEQEIRARIS